MPIATTPEVADHAGQLCQLSESSEWSVTDRQLAALVELAAEVSSAADVKSACRRLARRLKVYLGADRVVVGTVRRDGTCVPRADSEATAVRLTEPHMRQAQGVLQECAARADKGQWPPSGDGHRHGLMAHERFVRAQPYAVCLSVPLSDLSGSQRGAVLVATQESIDDSNRRFLDAAREPLGAALGLLDRAEGNRCDAAWNALRTFIHSRRLATLFIASLIAIVIMLVPISHRIRCKCVIQPALRRFVAAPV